MLRLPAVILLVAACTERVSPPAPPKSAPTAKAEFVRVAPSEFSGELQWRSTPRGDEVENVAITGAFVGRLVARFGPPDSLRLSSDEAKSLGWVLRETATGIVIVPHVGPHGRRSVGDGSAADASAFAAVAGRLDDLLETTPPHDCALVYPGGVLVNRAGVREGQPFLEHLGFRETMDFRLAALEQLDDVPPSARRRLERTLCEEALDTWAEGSRESGDTIAGYENREAARGRLQRCLFAAISKFEDEVSRQAVDAEAAPAEVEQLREWLKRLELKDAGPARRLEQLRKKVSSHRR